MELVKLGVSSTEDMSLQLQLIMLGERWSRLSLDSPYDARYYKYVVPFFHGTSGLKFSD